MATQSQDSGNEDVFELGQETKSEEAFSYDEEAANLVTEFKKHPEGRHCLKRISEKCLADFDGARKATEQYRVRMAEIWNLFAGTLEDRGPMFKDLANAHIPILMENIVRMVSRQAYELFGNWTQVFGVTPIGPDDEHTAKLLSLHGNWQIRKRIKDFKREMHRALLIFDLFGDVTVHSYWDPQRRSNRHEVLTAENFVCANSNVSTMPDYSDCAWVAKIIYMSPHELRKRAKSWEDVGTALRNLPPDWDDAEIQRELREEVDKSLGIDSTAYESGQYRIIQYEGWLNLPPSTQKNENGEENEPRDRYCQVFIETATQTVLAMKVLERADQYERKRFEFQMQQLQTWKSAEQERQAFQAEMQQTRDAALELGHSADPQSDVPSQAVAMAKAVQDMPPPPEAPMPDWMAGDPMALPQPPETVPIRLFTHIVNIEPVVGVMGMGMGSILCDQNKVANICTNLFLDQAALGNLKNFITKGEVRFREKLQIGPGKVHQIDGAVNLKDDIMPLDFGPANPQLLQMVKMMEEAGTAVSNTPEVLAGEAGKSGETAQGLASRIEQATKMLSVPTGKFADGLSNVLENNAQLNALFMEESEFFSVNNHDPELGKIGRTIFNVGREMYDRPFDVEISADLKFTSTSQRISEADALVQLPNSVPAMQMNYAFLFDVIKKSLEARNRYDLVATLGARPEPPQMFGAPTMPPAQPAPPPGAVPTPGPPGQGGATPQGGPPQPPTGGQQ